MAGTITCACGKEYRWKPEYAGKRAKCKCGGVVAFPAGDPTAAVAPPPPPPPLPDVPEGFEDSYSVADDAPPPPPPPPLPGRGSATTPPPIGAAAPKGGFKDSTGARGRGGFHWNWKAALNVLFGLGLLAFGIFEFSDIARREARGQTVRFTGRRSGWMSLMYTIGGKWAVLGFFVIVGLCLIGGAVLVMFGKIGHSDHEA